MDFMQLDYTGDAFIGTPFDVYDELDWRFLNSSNPSYGGTIFDCGDKRINLGLNVVTNGARVTVCCGSDGSNVVYLRIADANGVTIAQREEPRSGAVASEPICLFRSCKMRLYSLKLIKDGTLVRDFVPCKRVSDGAYGLYDRVEGKFYGNESGGAFVRP